MPSFAEQEATLKEVVHQDSQDSLPSSARVLSTPKRGYVASAKEVKEGQVTVGVHFSPEEFVAEAVRLGHPTDHSSLFPKEVKQNVEYIRTKSIHQLAFERTEEIKRWVTLATGNAGKERDR